MLLKTSQPISSSDLTAPSDLLPCSLIWRDHKLMVKLTSSKITLPATTNFSHLVECLRRSPIEAVMLDSKMNKSSLLWWAKACRNAGKDCYVSRPNLSTMKATSRPYTLQLKANPSLRSRSLWDTLWNKLVAMILLICSTPIIVTRFFLGMIGGEQISVQKKWAIGEQGKIFELFELTILNPSLDIQIPLTSGIIRHIPKLINVLQGDLNLFGSSPLCIDSSSQISSLAFNWRAKPGLFIKA
jgi:hypothetical protein